MLEAVVTIHPLVLGPVENPGTYGGGSSSNWTTASPGGYRGGGGGGGNVDGDSTTDGTWWRRRRRLRRRRRWWRRRCRGNASWRCRRSRWEHGCERRRRRHGQVQRCWRMPEGLPGAAGGGTLSRRSRLRSLVRGWRRAVTSNSVTSVGAGGGGGGGTYGTEALTTLFLGSGGGGGGGNDIPRYAGATGGKGGGIIFIMARTVSVTGWVTSNGNAGAQASSHLRRFERRRGRRLDPDPGQQRHPGDQPGHSGERGHLSGQNLCRWRRCRWSGPNPR